VHVRERVPDVVDRGTALPDALRHQPGAAVQVEFAHIGGMRWIGEKRERANMASARDLHLEQARRVHAPRHFALPQPRQRPAHAIGVDAVCDAPARAAAAQAHHQAGLALGAAVARRKDAQRPVVAVDQAARFLAVRKPR